MAGWNTTNIIDGTYTIRLTVYDTYGNTSTDSVTITVNSSLPTSSISAKHSSYSDLDSSITILTYSDLDSSIVITDDYVDLSSSITIMNHSDLDSSITITDSESIYLDGLPPRTYIQFRVRFIGDGSNYPTLNGLSALYSSEWYPLVLSHTTSSSLEEIKFYPVTARHMLILMESGDSAAKIYEQDMKYLV